MWTIPRKRSQTSPLPIASNITIDIIKNRLHHTMQPILLYIKV